MIQLYLCMGLYLVVAFFDLCVNCLVSLFFFIILTLRRENSVSLVLD